MTRILVVDDDSRIRRSVMEALSTRGFQVVGARDGFEAVSLCEAAAFDLVITDVNMPEMDGIELLRELVERTESVSVVAMSGGGLIHKDILLKDAHLLGAVAVLPKPFTLAQLFDCIDSVLDHDPSPP